MLDVNNFDQLRIGLATAESHPHLVQRRGEEAGDHQLPDAAPGEGRAVLREDLRSDQGLGVLLRQVQARPVPGHHLRALRRRGHPLQGPARADGPHRAGRPGRPHLVPARHPQLAGLPAHGHRGPRGAEGQAAGEGHLLRRQPGHLGRRGAAPRGPAQPRGRARRGARRASSGQRDLDIDRRFKALEDELAELEGEGAKDSEIKARQRPVGEGDRLASASGPRPSIDLAKRAFDEFRDLHARKIIEDELLWRELQDPLRRLLRGRHGRRGHRPADRPDRLRRRGGQAPRGHRRRPTAAGPCRSSAAEGHQAAEDRHGLQPPRRPRPPGQRPAGHDPRRRPGDPARAAPDGPARRWPLRHLRPQRPVPPGHQPQQPAEAAARPGRPRDHRQQREAHAPGGRRRPVRQRPPRPPGHRSGQPAAQEPVRHAEGQAGPVPPEPAGQARRLLGPLGHRGRPDPASCTSAACPSRWRSSCSSRSS